MDFVAILSIFVLACFVGYYVVWSVTPALHTPLMAVTNAISSVIIVGALIAAAAGALPATPVAPIAGATGVTAIPNPAGPDAVAVDTHVVLAPTQAPAATSARSWSKWLGLLAVVLASVNIFGGFAVTERMLAMYKKKERPAK